jgi:hypothetical protein
MHSTMLTQQHACFNVKAVIEIYTGHVDFKTHFHIKTCRLQTLSHDLIKFPVMKHIARGWCAPKAHLSTHKIRALCDGGFCQVV